MALTGNEILFVQGIDATGAPAATTQQTTTGAIAGLSGNGLTPDITNTAITTVGAGTLTAAGLLGGLITRTGPVAAYTDTTATAAAIVAAIGVFSAGGTFPITIKNATNFTQTLAAGVGVTLPPTNIVGPWQEVSMYGVIGGTAASPTVTFNHINTSQISDSPSVGSPLSTALSTVGAGVITAAMITGGIIARAGSQTNTAFTDTTDTGTAIVAANPGLIGKVGASMLVWYQNGTNANATLTGGVGVTVSGITVVEAGAAALYLITQTAANVLTMVGIAQTNPATANGTFAANGASSVTVTDSRITANSTVSFGLKTVGGTPAPIFMFAVTAGTSFVVRSTAGDTSTYNYRIVG